MPQTAGPYCGNTQIHLANPQSSYNIVVHSFNANSRFVISFSEHSMFIRLGWDKQDRDRFSVCRVLASSIYKMSLIFKNNFFLVSTTFCKDISLLPTPFLLIHRVKVVGNCAVGTACAPSSYLPSQ